MPGPAASAARLEPETVSRLRLAVVRLSRRLRQQGNPGITPSQLSVLSTLERHGPLGLKELAAIERVQPPSITRIVAALEVGGMVSRTVAEHDRRSAQAALTDEGRHALARLRRQRDLWLAQRVAALDPDEVEALHRALPALEKLIEESA
jgi:DNA-binding MarR family transcriptional regulator